MIILLHSSKTMRRPMPQHTPQSPVLVDEAQKLAAYVQTLSPAELSTVMHVSPGLAAKTQQLYKQWTTAPKSQSVAIDSFVGDIYSGLRASDLTAKDRAYAQNHLRILSGLYGILRPLDGIMPYRMELAYRLPAKPYNNLYEYWGSAIAHQLPDDLPILNLAAVEYSKTVTPYVAVERIITPRFLTVDAKTGEPTFVVVHAKIARGAFARWAIQQRISDPAQLSRFAEIGYQYDGAASTLAEPVFVCTEFGGKGLSMRLAPS